MHIHWKFYLANTPPVGAPFGTPAERIGELTQARGKQFTFTLNRPGNASFQMPVMDELAQMISPITTCLQIVRHEDVVWSGPIAGIQGALPDDKMTVNAVGWFDLLQNRELHAQKVYTPTTHAPAGVEWKNHEVAFDILDHINTQLPGYQTWIGPGTVASPPVGWTYADYQNTFEEGAKADQILTSMADLENGYDIWIDPVTRLMHIKHWRDYEDRTDVHFGYNWGPMNVQRLDYTIDGLKTRNRMVGRGAPGVGPALAQEPLSMDVYGVHEESVNLPEIQKLDHLLGYVGEEIVMRNQPEMIFNMTPFPAAHGNEDQVPRFMEDYFIGDQIYQSADRGSLSIRKQAVRLFSLTMGIDEEGNERVSNLTTSMSQGSS